MGELELIFDDKKNLEEIHISILEECRNIKTPKEMENYVLPLGAERFYPEPERIFHDTVPLPLDQLEKGRKKAVRQQDIILAMFREHPERGFTPWEINSEYSQASGGKSILIGSVRRSITDLTKEGRLRKGDHSDQMEEMHGVNNNRWRYNNEFIKPINPQK